MIAVESLIIISLLIFAMFSLIVFFSTDFGYSEKTESIKKIESETQINEKVEIANNIGFEVLIPILIIILFLVVIGFLFVKFSPYIMRKIKEKISEKENKKTSKEYKLGAKLRENDDGYEAAQYLAKSTDLLEKIIKNDGVKSKVKFMITIDKMEEILNMYLADRKAFAVPMYKYEKTFKVVYETLNKFIISKQLDKKDLSKIVYDLIHVPHEEIVKEKGFKWMYDKGLYEVDIIEDWKKLND